MWHKNQVSQNMIAFPNPDQVFFCSCPLTCLLLFTLPDTNGTSPQAALTWIHLHFLHIGPHNLSRSEIPPTLCGVLYCSFLTNIHRPICSNVYWGSLIHSAIHPLLFFRHSVHSPPNLHDPPPNPWLSESLWTNRSVRWPTERKCR